MTRTGSAARPPAPEDHIDNFGEWVRANARALAIGAVVVVALVAGGWVYRRTQEMKAANADRSLLSAEQALAQGNLPTAQTELERVVSRYGSTPAGVEAAMMLAQIHYEKREFERGISILDEAARQSPARQQLAVIRGLVGDGYTELGKHAEAAKAYEEAASSSRFEADKATFRSSAAYAYMNAGNKEAAVEIWKELAEDPSNPAAGEARVRLGELETEPASRS